MRKNWIGIDYLTLTYILFSIVYGLLGWRKIHNPLTHILTMGSIGIGILLLIHLSSKISSKLVLTLREWYPILLFGYFFEATTEVNLILFPDYLDIYFIKVEHWLFGFQPTLAWGEVLDTVWWQELLHFAYFCYYLMIIGIPLYFWIKDKNAFSELVFTITFVFYSCYIIYSILPVVGGRFFDEAMSVSQQFRHGPFTRIMALIYQLSPHRGGAFPSSHVAIALVITLISSKYSSLIGWILTPITALLCLGTVFCHYHYFVDMIAGILWALLMLLVAKRFYNHVGYPITETSEAT